MPWYRQDPGPCPVCGADHATCTTKSGPITIVQLPARDAMAGELPQPPLVAEIPSSQAERVQATLPPGQVTSGTYRRKKA